MSMNNYYPTFTIRITNVPYSHSILLLLLLMFYVLYLCNKTACLTDSEKCFTTD